MKTHIGLGSNVGEGMANLAEALRRVAALEHTRVLAVSQAYETEPWGVADQPPFVNAAAVIETGLRADELLGEFKLIERDMGRDHEAEEQRFGPRIIDLDILLCGDEEWETAELSVPHPRMAERDFVITPLLDVDPGAAWPDGCAVTTGAVYVGRVLRSLGPIPGWEAFPSLAEEPRADSGTRVEDPSCEQKYTPRPGADERWVPLLEHDAKRSAFGWPALFDKAGLQPRVDTMFVQVVLEQEGIPFAWDPFPPERESDPYGFSRAFKLLVPESALEHARDVLTEAMNAPVDWEDAENDPSAEG